MIVHNITPISDFDGFTPLQMHEIIYRPFDDDCPIKLNILTNEELFKESPILKIAIELLSNINGKSIKLTQRSNLPPNIVKTIYAKNYLTDSLIEDGIVKIRTETDWTILHNVRLVLTIAGFFRKKYNHLMLTKKGELLLTSGKYSEIFYEFLKSFALRFRWDYNDLFDNEAIGQMGFLYTLHLLNNYGSKERDIKYYSDLYFLAFPSFIENNEEDSMAEPAFYIRFIERFALWFGFLEVRIVEGKNYFGREIKIKRTTLLEHMFKA